MTQPTFRFPRNPQTSTLEPTQHLSFAAAVAALSTDSQRSSQQQELIASQKSL
jgi:hypothetical protein